MDIRYHHLLCLPRFEGKGYSADFCKNMANVKKRYNNEKITLVEHCDEICSHCPNNKGKEEEKVKSYDKKVKKLISLGIKPTPNDVCTDCKWYYICKNLD